MHVNGVTPVWNQLRVDDPPGSAASAASTDMAGSNAAADLRDLRRQVLTLKTNLKDLTQTLSPTEVAAEATPDELAATYQVAGAQAILAEVPTVRSGGEPDNHIEAHLIEFSRTLSSLFDDTKLLTRPGPILKVLRENIRASVSSVFNRRGPGFVPPFHFGFNFPAEPDPFTSEAQQTADILAAFHEKPEEFVEFMFGTGAGNADGMVPELQQALQTADDELSSQTGDVGIMLDLVA